jgi:uncharacterized protein YcbX
MSSPMATCFVQSLHVYPIKGARGVSLTRAEVLPSGIRLDRRFVVVDETGLFVSQREEPKLALVDVALGEQEVRVSASALEARIPLAPEGPLRRVRIWKDEVDAVDVGGDGASFFSQYLGRAVSLVFMPQDVIRQVDLSYARPGDRVAFADAFPLLVASAASLADLNERLEKHGSAPVPMNRFRPNVVVEGGAPFAEDEAPSARIGGLSVRLPKPCDRCQVTTIDQATAEVGKEPLRMLARFRRGKDDAANKVYFAVNAIPDLAAGASATIAVGDPVGYAATPG